MVALSQERFWKAEVGPGGLGQLSPGSAALCLQDDLVRTIGVSAALGAAGVVLWGDLSLSSSEVIIAPPAATRPRLGVPGRAGERPRQGHGAGTLIRPSPFLRRSAGTFMTTWWTPWAPT